MTNALIIWLPVEASNPWVWTDANGGTGQAEDAEERAALSAQAAGKVIAILPGQWGRIYPHDLPKMREAERLSAAGFSVEDQTAATLSLQHIALGAKDDDRIAVIAKDKMKRALAALTDAGFNPDGFYLDYDVLSTQLEPIKFDDRIVVPGPQGHTLDPDWNDGEFNAARQLGAVEAAALVQTSKAINLRQGEFARRAGLKLGNIGFGRAAAMLAVLGLTWGVLQTANTRALNQQTEAWKDEASRLFSQATGNSAPANPALAVTRAVKDRPETGVSYLSLSQSLFDAIAQADGVEIDTIQYDQASQQLNLRLIYPQFESAGELERIAAARGGTFRPGGVREQGGQLIGDALFTIEGQS